MTKAELLARMRLDLGDTSEPYGWTDAELTSYLQDAEQEAAERADLIKVSGVSTYCDITLEAGTGTYAMNTLVYDVKTARVSGVSSFLERTSREKLDREKPAWEDDTGTPSEYFIEGNNITVYPVPAAAGTLKIVVLRLPVTPMSTSPEIHSRHHVRMLDWAYHIAYSKHDEDFQDLAKSRNFEARFEVSFGPRWDAKQQTRRLKRSPTTMRDSEYGEV